MLAVSAQCHMPFFASPHSGSQISPGEGEDGGGGEGESEREGERYKIKGVRESYYESLCTQGVKSHPLRAG